MTKDINKLCFLPGSLLPLKDGKYPYISLLKQGLTNLGVTFPTPVPGAPGLTATQIAFGDGSNLMTSSSDLQFTANALTIESRGGYWNANGTGQDIYLRSTGSNYVYLTTGGLVQLGDPLGNGNGNKIEISDAYNLAYYDNTAHAGFFGINTSSPSVALDVVGTVNISEVLTLNPIAYASLPASPTMGMIACINDSGGGDWGDIVVSGGATISIIFYNGTDWKIMGK